MDIEEILERGGNVHRQLVVEGGKEGKAPAALNIAVQEALWMSARLLSWQI